MKHFLYCPFTGLGLHKGFRGQTWLRNRISVFKNFVLPSLVHQSNRNFVLWISFRPEEEGNPAVMDLESTLQSMRDFPFVFTYGGVCMEDDKYDRPKSLERLEYNLARTMPYLQEIVQGQDEVVMTIQPSDDMYLSQAVKEIQDKVEELDLSEPHSIGYKKGYIMNMKNLELSEYKNDTIPPFFSVIFPRDVFLDAEAHMKWAPYRSHEYIADHTKYHELKGRGFIVGTHGENISTTYEPYKGREIIGAEREKIFLQAGLFDPEPIKLRKDKGRMLEQKFINVLPKPLKRSWMRMRSPGLGEAINDYSWFRL